MKELFEWFTPIHRWQVKLGLSAFVLLIGYIFIGRILHSGVLLFAGLIAWSYFWIKFSYKHLKVKPVDELPLVDKDPTTYGERLKQAYAFKFGAHDIAFDKDIDSHILANQSLPVGLSRVLNVAWLKRMATFVEVPWM